MENKTAVEWLFNQFQRTGIYPKYSVDNEENNSKQDLIHTLIEKAKEMEKEQKIEFAEKYANSDSFYCSGEFDIEKGAEQYYNETFKSE